MKNILPLLILSVTLVSCEAIEGNLQLNETLNVKVKKTGLFQSGTKDMEIPAGAYEAKLNPTSKTNIDLELKVADKTRKIPFAIPKGTELPEREGQLSILSDTSGQPYDLLATVSTETSSYDFDRTETCVVRYVQERRCITTAPTRTCRFMPGRSDCRVTPRGERVCREIPGRQECVSYPPVTNCNFVQVPIYGNQVVAYEKIMSTRHVDVEISAAGKNVGNFKHAKTSSSDVPRNYGPCY